MLMNVPYGLGKEYWGSKYLNISKLEVEGVVKFSDWEILRKRTGFTIENMYSAPWRIGTAPAALAENRQGWDVWHFCSPAAAFLWCLQWSKEGIKIVVNFPLVLLEAEAQKEEK